MPSTPDLSCARVERERRGGRQGGETETEKAYQTRGRRARARGCGLSPCTRGFRSAKAPSLADRVRRAFLLPAGEPASPRPGPGRGRQVTGAGLPARGAPFPGRRDSVARPRDHPPCSPSSAVEQASSGASPEPSPPLHLRAPDSESEVRSVFPGSALGQAWIRSASVFGPAVRGGQ